MAFKLGAKFSSFEEVKEAVALQTRAKRNFPRKILIVSVMAKNTNSSQFRNIDVDQYNEDNYNDEDEGQALSRVDESTVISLLNSGNQSGALKLLLENAPMTSKGKNEQAKEIHLALVLKVLLSVNRSQIEQIISSFDNTLLDVLMKYIYRGLEKPSEKSSAILLQWHEQVYNISGVGCIVRVLTDRKRV